MTYTIDGEDGQIGVAADTDRPAGDVTEVVMMNELGGRDFDRYTDADGADLRGAEIGTWDEVDAPRGRASSARRTRWRSRSGRRRERRLSRGRELIGARLAWSGFGYSLPPTPGRFAYDVRIERTP